MRTLRIGYNPSFNYGGELGNADEGDTVNGRQPYAAPVSLQSSFNEGRGVQLVAKKVA
ncbi:hypothetical protein GIV21_24160 [Pseudomonas syringae]|uniref:hypothetical protein n=1 Tax=Pseudomonas syringae group TaxID=136849 RepID=UPI0013D9E4DD|nr:hypothetical protein [Pseudomonas viridiflava]MCF9021219.1 hypothetical protein [Pseudomonas syringae]